MSLKQEPFKVSRRNFLKLALGTGAAVGVGLGMPRFARAEDSLVEQDSKVVNGFCGVCSGGCALHAYVKDDRLVHVVGNPHDQAAEGKLCVKAYASIRTLYDPDRLKYPMKRTNPEKGIGVDPGFVKISWDEAYDIVAEKLNHIKEKYGPESILFFMRSHPFSNRLGKAIGTPNFVAHQSTCFTTQQAAWMAMFVGSGRLYTYDLENCKYILGFGFDGLGKSKNMHLRNITRALASGSKMVILDPYMSVTASKAHEWLAIKPGTDLAFCLAMINVIVAEGLFDKNFVENYTSGFEHLPEFSKDYTPEWAADITGIPADTIRRIAREFATTKPAHIHSHKRDAAGPNYVNSTKLAQAQTILNALVGTIDRKGGIILRRMPRFPNFEQTFPAPPYPPAVKQRIDGYEKEPIIGKTQTGNFATIADGMLSGKPYPAKAAVVRKYNVLAFPNARKMAKALSDLEFMVCMEIYPSEMAHLADIVLPEPHWYEITGFSAREFFAMYPQVAVRNQVVKPLYETKGFGTIIIDIAKRMGYGNYFEGVSGGAWNEAQLKSIGTSWAELSGSPTGLWSDVQPFKPAETFSTPSKKIELYSTVFEANGFDPLPTWQPKREDASAEYPFYFLINRPPMHKMTESQNNSLVMEVSPENHAIMHVDKAKSMGIRDGNMVIVESRVGTIKLKAKLIEGIRRDCVAVMHGFGHWSNDLTLAHGVGANDGDLIPDLTVAEQRAMNDPGAGACMLDFCVKIYKA